jgi:hypothetical protein
VLSAFFLWPVNDSHISHHAARRRRWYSRYFFYRTAGNDVLLTTVPSLAVRRSGTYPFSGITAWYAGVMRQKTGIKKNGFKVHPTIKRKMLLYQKPWNPCAEETKQAVMGNHGL